MLPIALSTHWLQANQESEGLYKVTDSTSNRHAQLQQQHVNGYRCEYNIAAFAIRNDQLHQPATRPQVYVAVNNAAVNLPGYGRPGGEELLLGSPSSLGLLASWLLDWRCPSPTEGPVGGAAPMFSTWTGTQHRFEGWLAGGTRCQPKGDNRSWTMLLAVVHKTLPTGVAEHQLHATMILMVKPAAKGSC